MRSFRIFVQFFFCGLLLVMLCANVAHGQNQNFTFNTSVLGWTATGPFNEKAGGPFTPNAFDSLVWSDVTNFPLQPGFDTAGNQQGSLILQAAFAPGYADPVANNWIMKFHSPDLSSLVLWQRNAGFSVEVIDGMSTKDSATSGSLAVVVFDSTANQSLTFTSPTPRPLFRDTWTRLSLDWSLISGFPTRCRIQEVQVIVTGFLTGFTYRGGFYVDNVTVLGLPPPSLQSPADSAVDVPTSPVFKWNPATGAILYQLQISTNFFFDGTVFDSLVVGTTRQVTGLFPNSTYYWRVNAANNLGQFGPFSATRTFITAPPPPPAPTLASPPNGSPAISTSPTLSWNPVAGANSYVLQVATDSLFSSPVFDSSGITTTSGSLSGLARSTIFYWRVAATNAGGNGLFTAPWTFTTIPPPPPPPVLASPPNDTTGLSTSIVLVWNRVPVANTYHIQLAIDSLFTTLAFDTSGDPGTSAFITGLSTGTTYYWHVSSSNAGGNGAFSQFWRFTTQVSPPAIPTLLSPANGFTGVPLPPVLSWNSAARATSYRMQVAADSFFQSAIYDSSGIANTSQAVAGLAFNSTYYWRVRASNAGGNSLFSAFRRFVTQIAPPATPTLLSPVNNSAGITLPPLLSWNAALGAASYRLQVGVDSSFASSVFDSSGIITTSRSIPGLANNTTYYWRVRAANLGGSSLFSPLWRFTTQVSPPASPTLVSPANAATGIAVTPLLSWNAPPGATSYRLQVSADSIFTSTVYDSTGLTSTSRSVAGLTTNTTYYWRVNAANAGGTGPFSAFRRFTTQVSLAAIPTLLSPADGSIGVGLTPLLSWSSALGATSYRLQIATDSLFAAPAIDDSTITTTSAQAPPLLNGTLYYWHVRGRNAAGSGGFSSVWKFTTQIAPPTTPTLLSPANGSTGIALPPLLSWNGVPGAAAYRLQMAVDSSFASSIFDSSGIITTSRSIAGLANNVTYYWRVNASNAGGNSQFSALWRFTTQVSLPASPTLVSPANAATGISLTPLLSWNAPPGATSYRLQVSADSLFETSVVDTSGLTATSRSVAGLTTNTIYYWRVSAANAGGTGPLSVIRKFTTQVSLATIPTLLSPANGSIGVGLTPLLSWSTALGATSYRLQIATDSLFVAPAIDDSTISSTSTQAAPLLYGTLYYWRVRGRNAAGSSGFSAVWRFTTIQAPPSLSVPLTTLSFGNITVGQSKLDSVIIGNAGGSLLLVSHISLSGQDAAFFSADTTSFTLKAQEHRGIQVRFAPTQNRTFQCTMKITSNGGSAAVTLSGNGQDPAFTLVPVFRAPSAGDTLGVSFAVPPTFGATSAVLHFRNGGERTYRTGSLDQTGSSLLAVIPSSAVNIRGIEYYATIANATDTLIFPGSILTNPAVNPSVIQVRVEKQVAPVALVKNQYHMISVPADLSDPQINAVLSDNFGEYNTRFWRILRWNGSTYQEPPELTTPFTPGNAFWIVTFDVPGFDIQQGRSLNSLTPYQLILQPGWNQIADPFAFPVDWDSVAGSAKLAAPYFFDGTEFLPGVRVLNPWDGYFVWNDSTGPLVLSIPPRESIAPLGKAASHSLVSMQVSASIPGTTLRDSHCSFGFIERGTEKGTAANLPKPPPVGEYVRTSIREGGRDFMSSFVPLPDSGRCWNMEISSTTAGIAHVALTLSGGLPDGFNTFVLDLDAGTGLPSGIKEFDSPMGGKGATHHYRIIIGTTAYARRVAGEIPLTPQQFSLEQNYPNPFNPATTIRYSLGSKSNVILEIFNVLGERVQTLVNAEESAGVHGAVWQGKNDAGAPVASGVYYARLKAGSFVATKKLLLMR